MQDNIETQAYIALYHPQECYFYVCMVRDWIKHNREALEEKDIKQQYPSRCVFPLGIYDTKLEAQQACMEYNKTHTTIISI